MDFVLDLSTLDTDRYFVVGDIKGDYDQFIALLYQQKFGYKDTLITTGNMLSMFKESSKDSLLFIKNVVNAYSTKGKNEVDLEKKLDDDPNDLPPWLSEMPKKEDLFKFIEELPLIIKITDYIYVVNAGVEPTKSIEEQNPEAFYSIGVYDKDSRFYQFENPQQKSWYDFDFYKESNLIKFCFGNLSLTKESVSAGYPLGRDEGTSIKCLIFKKGQDQPILVQST